jgi:hypothetical protein
MMRDEERARTLARYDKIISHLMNALDLIRREAENRSGSTTYILGVAVQSMADCNAQRERNSDGYLVVKKEGAQ